jgi:hypothetical protein
MNVSIPTISNATCNPNSIFVKRIMGIHVYGLRQSKAWRKVLWGLDSGAVHDPKTLLFGTLVCFWGSTMSYCQVINDNEISFILLIVDGIAIFHSIVEQIIVIIEKLLHLLFVEESELYFTILQVPIVQLFDDCTGHSQMQPYRLAPADRMPMHHRMQHTRIAIHADQS